MNTHETKQLDAGSRRSGLNFSLRLRRGKRGSALVMAVVFVTIFATIVAYVMLASNRQRRNTQRSRLFNTSLAAAATIVKSMTQQAYYVATTRPAQVGGNFDQLDSVIMNIKPVSPPHYLSPKHGGEPLSYFKAATENNGENYTVIDDPEDDWYGFLIRRWGYDAVAFQNAAYDPAKPEGVGVTTVDPTAARMGFEGAGFSSHIQINYIPLYQFAIFYENDLEIHPGPVMDVLGRVHSNSTLWIAAGSGLTFQDRVSAAGNFRTERDFKAIKSESNLAVGGNQAVNAYGHDMDAHHEGPVGIKERGSSDNVKLNRDLADGVDTNGNTFLDSLDDNWLEEALETFGGNLTDVAMGNKPIRPPLPFVGEGEERKQADPAELIQRIDESVDSPEMQQTKMEGMADIRITGDPSEVSNGQLTDILIEPATHDENGFVTGYGEAIPNRKIVNGVPTGDPIVKPGVFVDNREDKTVYTFDVDMGELAARDVDLQKIQNGNGLLYVSTEKNDPNGTKMNAVRLINAEDVPASDDNTLTVATDRPMYLEGDVNTENKATLLLAADAVTVTSQHLRLNRDDQTPKRDAARDTTTNAIFMLGQVSSQYVEVDEHGRPIPGGETSDHYLPGYGRVSQSGGAHNVLRYLENWSDVEHEYNGSLICLYESRVAITPFDNSGYYNPPDRDYNWDESLKTSVPPKGMPILVEVVVSPLERISKADAVADMP